MTGPLDEDFVCADCGGRVRVRGGDIRKDLDGTVLGIEEGVQCIDCDNFGTILSTNGEDDEPNEYTDVYRVEGLVQR